MNFLNQKIYPSVAAMVLNQRPLSTVIVMFVAMASSLMLMLLSIEPLQSLEERLGALPWTISSDSALEERVTIVAIDERSIEGLGPWPWSRAVMAELTEKIFEAGAQVQVHDVVYPPGNETGDSVFVDALGSAFRRGVAVVDDFFDVLGEASSPVSTSTDSSEQYPTSSIDF